MIKENQLFYDTRDGKVYRSELIGEEKSLLRPIYIENFTNLMSMETWISEGYSQQLGDKNLSLCQLVPSDLSKMIKGGNEKLPISIIGFIEKPSCVRSGVCYPGGMYFNLMALRRAISHKIEFEKQKSEPVTPFPFNGAKCPETPGECVPAAKSNIKRVTSPKKKPVVVKKKAVAAKTKKPLPTKSKIVKKTTARRKR